MQIDFDVDGILAKRNLGPSGAGPMLFAEKVHALMAPYAPMSGGAAAHFGNRASFVPVRKRVRIVYPGPYAHYLYIGKAMGPAFRLKSGEWRSPKGKPKHYNGRSLNYSGAPMRGPEWDKRMMRERRHDVVAAAAAIIGGKAHE